jgi:2',3'-cyclic-nucleotide 2'-phosphodiesterase (5'-nucleotidase family)
MEAAQAQSRGAARPPIVPSPEAGIAAVQPGPDPAAKPELPDVPPSQQIRIGFSGGAVGDTDPCGCAHNPLGGLAKRVRWWMQQTQGRPNALAFDVGGLMVPNVPNTMDRPGEAVARADVFLRAMSRAGYAGLNVGAHELALGLADLRRLAATHHIPLLSANLYDMAGKPAFQRTFIKQVGPLKVGVFGLIAGQPMDVLNTLQKQGLRVESPNPVATTVVKELQQQGCQLIVVLSQMSRIEVDSLMTQVKGIDLVLGSVDMDLTNDLLGSGDAFFADTFTKGKYMGLVTISVRGSGHLYAANMTAALNTQRAELASQVQMLQAQIEQSTKPDSPLKLNKEARDIIDHQLAALRARMQRVTLDLDSGVAVPKGANTIAMEMVGMGQDMPDDPDALRWVDKLKLKYPKVAGH